MTGYLTKLKAEMEGRLGCGIEVVEDRDLGCSCKFEFARNYARKHHVLRVNPARCVNDYPVFYNLLNVKLQLQELDDGSLGVVQPVSNAQESDRFNADFAADPVGRVAQVQKEIEFVRAHRELFKTIAEPLQKGEIPLRIGHNDCVGRRET